LEDLIVSRHVIDRFRERTGAKYSDTKVIDKLKSFYKSGQKEKLKKVTYVYISGYCMVVKKKVIVTIHKGSPITWRHF